MEDSRLLLWSLKRRADSGEVIQPEEKRRGLDLEWNLKSEPESIGQLMMMNPGDPANQSIHGKSPAAWLTEICVKTGANVKYDDTDLRSSPSSPPLFEVRCTITGFQGRSFECAERESRKQFAKQRSAISMLNLMGVTKTDLGNMVKRKNLVFGSIHASQNSKNNVVSSSTSPGPAPVRPTEASPGQMPSQSSPGQLPFRPAFQASPGQMPFRQVASPMPLAQTAQACSTTPMRPVQFVAEGNGGSGISSTVADLPFDGAKDYLGELINYCRQNNFPVPEFILISQSGPPHLPQFTMACKIDMIGQPLTEELTQMSSQIKIKRMLAFRMLAKLPHISASMSESAKLAKKQKADNIAKQDESIVEEFRRISMRQKREVCTMEDCQELYSHDHHKLKTYLVGDIVDRIKEFVATGDAQLEGRNAVTWISELEKERKVYGHDVSLEFFPVSPEVGIEWACFSKFVINGMELAGFGVGVSKESAKAAAARKLLQVTAEMAG